MPPPTQAEIDAALALYRGLLVSLHDLARERDRRVRARSRRLDLIDQSNVAIAAKRAAVKSARVALANLLNQPGPP